MAMYRDDHLGEKVLLLLKKNGRMMVEAISEEMNEKPRSVATACVNLHRMGKAQSIISGRMIRNRMGKKKPEVYWEIVPAENIHSMPNRVHKRCGVTNGIFGIDDEDLKWMEHYRQQRMKRQQLSSNDARLRL